MARKESSTVTNWVGWIFFASFLLVLNGGMQIIAGLVAIFNSDFYVVSQDQLMLLDFTTWGWANLILGLLVLATGISLLSGRTWARIVAMFLVILAALSHVSFLNAYPIWGMIAITLDVLIIYALLMHGDELSTK